MENESPPLNPQVDAPTLPNFTFNGVDGIGYSEFIQAVRQHAFDNGKSRANAWIADTAALHFSGPALDWFENLDDATQDDWKLLKRAIVLRYANTGVEENGTSNGFVFSGDNHVGAERLVQTIRRQAFATGKMNDDRWMADLASTCLVGRALRWHLGLSAEIRSSWNRLESSLLQTFPPPDSVINLDAKKIGIQAWNEAVIASSLRFPLSEEEWLQQGRARRARITDPGSVSAMWYLVEVDEQIPPNAIPTGHENGSHLFCIRTWHQGGLAPGKHGRHNQQGSFTWYGQEYLCHVPYEILVGNSNSVRWVTPSSGPFVAIEGGFKTHSDPILLIAGADQDGNWQLGKAFSSQLQAYIGWSWREHQRGVSDVKILAWVDSSIR